MTSPFAEYELTEVPPIELVCSMAVGQRLALDPAAVSVVSRRRSDLIFVQGSEALFSLGWGGTQNHRLSCSGGVWQVEDLGHGKPAFINGARLPLEPRSLRDGDRISPARGLVFTFFQRDDLEPLADELASQLHVFEGEERVLIDWLLERGLRSREEAGRAVMHFRYRLMASGAL